MAWTPYEIEIVLHHYCSRAPFDRHDAPAYWPTVANLVKLGVINKQKEVEEIPSLTDLGEGLVQMWTEQPLPSKSWKDPRFG